MQSIHLKDDQYPFKGISRKRIIVRGIVFSKDGKVAIHRLKRNDMFGDCSYFETPGGGVKDGEDLVTALKRECLEELGCKIDQISEVGQVFDFYNLLSLENQNHFFVAHLSEEGCPHFVSKGDKLIEKTLWLSLDEAITRYENMGEEGIPLLVKRRELPILKEVKSLIREKKLLF